MSEFCEECLRLPQLSSEAIAFGEDFVNFMNEACSPYHAISAVKTRLAEAEFVEILETDRWNLQRGGKYFFIRNGTSLIAFVVGNEYCPGNGFTMVGAHTDSPCLRIKPVHTCVKGDALVLNTQPYGGGLWHTWFDRDLGLAGRVIFRTAEGMIDSRLVRINRPVARIPNLAIHLQSASERESFAPNLHEHAKAILTMNPGTLAFKFNDSETKFNPCLLALVCEECKISPQSVVDMELQLIDLQPSTFGGASNEFIFSGRLDNLCSSYQCTRALIDSSRSGTPGTASNIQMIMLFDHEEVGSQSINGAGSSMFMDTLRLIDSAFSDEGPSSLTRALRKSIVISSDMAHGCHPNYAAKHDASMAPKINMGMVVKHNCNQRYATNQVSATLFREFARLENLKIQEFTVRADAACGTTIGPITAGLSGILTVDVGSPQFSMHSIREMMGTEDVLAGFLSIRAAFIHHAEVASKFKF